MELEPTPPAYRIETERLVVRCWEPEDVALLDDAVRSSLEHLRPWMPWSQDEPIAPSERLDYLRDCRSKFDADEDYTYGIFQTDESEVVGATGLHTGRGDGTREIGYWIREEQTNRGFATEAARALTHVGLRIVGVDRIEIRCAPDNDASAAIPEKLGFEQEGTLRNAGVDVSNDPRDTQIWSMTPDRLPDSLAADPDVTAYDILGHRLTPSA